MTDMPEGGARCTVPPPVGPEAMAACSGHGAADLVDAKEAPSDRPQHADANPPAASDTAQTAGLAGAPSERGGPSHRIVVVGGGAGGLELVTRLGDRLGKSGRAEVTLVEPARTHLWKPLLHEVAAGSLDLDDHALDYLAQAHWHHFRYRIGEMIGLDRAGKARAAGRQATTTEAAWSRRERAFPYDTLGDRRR